MTHFRGETATRSLAPAEVSGCLASSGAVVVAAPAGRSLEGITRQSLVNMAGGVISQGLKFWVFVLIARQFAPTEFGEFSFAWAVNSFIFVIANFGLPTFGARRVSNNGTIGSTFALEMFLCRCGLGLAGTFLGELLVLVQPHANVTEAWLVGIFGLSNVAQAGIFDWAFQGLGRLDISAILNITWQALWLAMTSIGFRFGAGVQFVGTAMFLSAGLTSGLSYILLRRYWDREAGAVAKEVLRSSWQLLRAGTSLGTASVIITVLVWSDTLIVRIFRGEQAVAFYAAGNRASLALAMLASLYVQGAFPSLTRAASRSRAEFVRSFQQCYEDIALYFVPGALWSVFFAPEILVLLFKRPEYLAAVPIFRIFQITFLLTAFWNLCGMGLFVAFHRDREYQNILLTTAALSVPLCVLLTISFGITAASAGVLAAQAFCLAMFCWRGRDHLGVSHRPALFWPCTAGMGASLLSRAFGWGLLGSGMLLAATYAVLLSFRYCSFFSEP
jgi:O-antigen/teichoic acid export membrane protein